MHRRILLILMVAALVMVVPASAATFNILWYTGGTEPTSGAAFTTYSAAVSQLVTDAAGVGNTWNVTLWTGGALPSGTFNSLVVASPQGDWSTFPDDTALNASSLAGSFDPTTSRDMITGQDADWHFQNFPSPSNFDGPQGFLVDSIDWASAGTGMGLVVLGDVGESSALLDATGTGAESATGNATTTGNATNNVVIPAAEASFPINTGLTSAALSNWNRPTTVGLSATPPFGMELTLMETFPQILALGRPASMSPSSVPIARVVAWVGSQSPLLCCC